jgi:hypothetical protein
MRKLSVLREVAVRNEDYVLQDADREFSAAVAYYDGQEPGLGQRFEDEIDRAQ